jgi:hypothetical protein
MSALSSLLPTPESNSATIRKCNGNPAGHARPVAAPYDALNAIRRGFGSASRKNRRVSRARVLGLCLPLLGSSLALVPQRGQAQSPSSVKFDSIRFIVHTGGDDLRGDSSSTAELFSVNGQALQTLTLKAQNAGSWGNNSVHTVEAKLAQPLSGDEIGRVAVTLTSHNGMFETDDNWNVNEMTMQLYSGGSTYQLVDVKGNPYVRLTGSQPTKSIPVPWQSDYGTVFPKYQIYALVYAVPGCTSTSNAKCQLTGQVQYGQGSSNGTQVSTSSSFKAGVSMTATEGSEATGSASETAGFSTTTSNGQSQTITKQKNNTLVISGNGDGVDHGQDYFVVLTNPEINLQTLSPTSVGWTMGYKGPIPHFVNLTVQDLSAPEKMNPGKLSELKGLGFTPSDYAEILSQDPLAKSANLDPRRYSPVAWSFPYNPPNQANDCNGGVCTCPNSTVALSNTVQDQTISGTATEVDVSFTVGGPLVPGLSLKTTDSFTWTNSSSTTNTESGTQSAQASIACPSPAYTGPQEMDVYWDSVYGSFVFVPYQSSQEAVVQSGQVIDSAGNKVGGAPVTLNYAGKVYRTFTGRDGTYKFVAPVGKVAALPNTAQVTVRGVSSNVPLRTIEVTKLNVPKL